MIELNHVSFAYQTGETSETQVLCDVNFQAAPGECVVLCGKSGCGKTTMLRLVNGLVPHFYAGKLEGSALVGGLDVRQTTLPQMSRVVGSVFQNPRTQFFHLDTTGEMAFNLENQNVPRSQMQERLKEVVYRLNLQELMDRNIFELSGGEKQQIACGSIYASLPQIIVMDEPSSNLDMESIRKLQKLIRIMKEEGKTVLISEHRLWYLEEIADRYVLLENGRISWEFTPETAANLSGTQRDALGLRAVKREQLYESRSDVRPMEQKDIGLEIDGLQFSRQMRQVLNVPHLKIPRGAIVAVIGENGAGKSTLSLCLAGLLKHSGTVRIEGEKISHKKLPEQAYLVMQEAGHQLFGDTVLGELTLNNKTLTEEQAKAALAELGLTGMENRHPGSLSGGQQQRLSLGTALCTKRRLMLYDEPTSGQDGENLLRTVEMIRAANEQAACTLIVTHDPELILRCATHILHIHAGEVKKFIPFDERGVSYMKKVFGENAQTKKPRKTGIPRLLEFAGRHRPLLSVAQLLAGISALFLLGPFLCVYYAARELLVGLTSGGFDTAALVQWGVWALVLELTGLTAAGDLTAFTENFLFYLIFAPACASVLNKIMYMSNYKMQAMESMRRIDTILLSREQPEAQEPQTTQDSGIRFDHVTFTYPTGEKPAISDVSFTAKAGTVTALVGHSGSGACVKIRLS